MKSVVVTTLLGITILLVVLLVEESFSAPVDTRLKPWKQPNGVTFMARSWGDEFAIWCETADGYRFVWSPGGWFRYATLDSSGEYSPTAWRVGIDPPPSESYKLERSPRRMAEIKARIAEFNAQIAKLNPTLTRGESGSLPTEETETYTVGIIFVEFQDVRHYQSTPPDLSRPYGYYVADFDKMMFSTNGEWFDTTLIDGTPYPDAVKEKVFGSMQDYWDQMSGNRLQLVPTFINPTEPSGIPRWILLDHNKEYYYNTKFRLRDEAFAKAVDSNMLNPSVWQIDPVGFDRYIYVFAGHQPDGVILTHGGDGTFI